MFKSRWGALLFVCLTAFGAANLIGGEDDQGVLLDAANELTRAKGELGNHQQEFSRPDAGDSGRSSTEEDLAGEFVPDDDLIDEALGFDPLPDIDPTPELDRAKEEGDVVIYIDKD